VIPRSLKLGGAGREVFGVAYPKRLEYFGRCNDRTRTIQDPQALDAGRHPPVREESIAMKACKLASKLLTISTAVIAAAVVLGWPPLSWQTRGGRSTHPNVLSGTDADH